jgi:hypothetical protein
VRRRAHNKHILKNKGYILLNPSKTKKKLSKTNGLSQIILTLSKNNSKAIVPKITAPTLF